MPLPVLCTQPVFHSSLYAFQHYAAVTHLPNRAEHDRALNDASAKQGKLCEEQRQCLDRQGNGQININIFIIGGERKLQQWIWIFECRALGRWTKQRAMRITRWPLQRTLEIGAQRKGARCTGNSANKTYGVCSILIWKQWYLSGQLHGRHAL